GLRGGDVPLGAHCLVREFGKPRTAPSDAPGGWCARAGDGGKRRRKLNRQQPIAMNEKELEGGRVLFHRRGWLAQMIKELAEHCVVADRVDPPPVDTPQAAPSCRAKHLRGVTKFAFVQGGKTDVVLRPRKTFGLRQSLRRRQRGEDKDREAPG